MSAYAPAHGYLRKQPLHHHLQVHDERIAYNRMHVLFATLQRRLFVVNVVSPVVLGYVSWVASGSAARGPLFRFSAGTNNAVQQTYDVVPHRPCRHSVLIKYHRALSKKLTGVARSNCMDVS